jgi:hypothetical protein
VDNDKVPMITAFRDLNDNAIHLLPRAIEDGTYRIRISDLSGRRIFEEEVKLEAGKPRRLGLENLSQSIYLLHAMGRQRVLSNKFKID